MNIPAMRMGPGEHLKGLTLMGGAVKPEEFDYFHEVCPAQVLQRQQTDPVPVHHQRRNYPLRYAGLLRWHPSGRGHRPAACAQVRLSRAACKGRPRGALWTEVHLSRDQRGICG